MQYELAGWKLRREWFSSSLKASILMPRRADSANNVQRQSTGGFAFIQCASFFSLFRLLMDWMKPTDIIKGNLLYLEFTDLNAHVIQKYHPIWHMKLTFTVYYRQASAPWLAGVQTILSPVWTPGTVWPIAFQRFFFQPCGMPPYTHNHAMISFHPNNCEECFINSCRFLFLSLPPPSTLLCKF